MMSNSTCGQSTTSDRLCANLATLRRDANELFLGVWVVADDWLPAMQAVLRNAARAAQRMSVFCNAKPDERTNTNDACIRGRP